MSGLCWLAVGLAAAWAVAGVAIAVGIGRSIRVADDDHDVWGCDVCERQAVEQAMQRHPSSRARELAELEALWEAS